MKTLNKLYYALFFTCVATIPSLIKANLSRGPEKCFILNQDAIQTQGINGTLTISEPGKYCATEKLVGNIVIGASDICVDLGCHTLDANLNGSGITVEGKEGITISNGHIINTASTIPGVVSAGISIRACKKLEISNILFNDHELALFIDRSNATLIQNQSVTISNCSFTQSIRCLDLRRTDDLLVERCNVFENSGDKAPIALSRCSSSTFKDVKVSNNELTGPNRPFDDFFSNSFFFIDKSTAVILENCMIDSNHSAQRTNLFGLAIDGLTVDGSQFPFVFTGGSREIQLVNCQITNTTLDVGDPSLTGGKNVIGLLGWLSEDIYIDRCQFNRTQMLNSQSEEDFAQGVWLAMTPGVKIENSQFNRNANSGGSSNGLSMTELQVGPPLKGGISIKGCQANNNGGLLFDTDGNIINASKNVTGFALFLRDFPIFIDLPGGCGGQIVECQANGNIGQGLVTGITCAWSGTSITRSQANCNISIGAQVQGIALGTPQGADTTKGVAVEDCEASHNIGIGAKAFGVLTTKFEGGQFGTLYPINNIRLKNVTCSENESDLPGEGIGIVLDGSKRSQIIDCLVTNNSGAGFANPGAERCAFLRNTAESNGLDPENDNYQGIIGGNYVRILNKDLGIILGAPDGWANLDIQ